MSERPTDAALRTITMQTRLTRAIVLVDLAEAEVSNLMAASTMPIPARELNGIADQLDRIAERLEAYREAVSS